MKIFAVAKKSINFAVAIFANRGVAQLAARHVRDVEVGSSSLLTPTKFQQMGLAQRVKPILRNLSEQKRNTPFFLPQV